MDPVTVEEVLYDSARTHITRVRTAGGERFLRKQPLGPRAAERLRAELAALRRLQGLPGIPQLAPDSPEGVLTLVDTPAKPISARSGPWPIDTLLELAQALAEVLAGVHRHGVIHRDISPRNIITLPDGQPTLIGFELAVLPAQDRTLLPTDDIAGTLPYMAPEQTGRTGRPVDHRCDLYALGATLYELATGTPPFGREGDALSLIHDHLARMPPAPQELRPDLPPQLSAVVMRLLSKDPDRRYQSAEGLAHDLGLLRTSGADAADGPFSLGARDFPIRLVPPARLIGRDAQVAALQTLFDRALHGHSVLGFLAGPSGAGKTALVRQFRPLVTAAGGRLVTGKFDQFQGDQSGGGLLEALDNLGTQLLADQDETLTALRERLRDRLGPDQYLMATLFPSFQALLGLEAGDPVADDPATAFARLRAATLAVLRTVVTRTGPLVLFLDDLQWAQPGVFQFLDDVLGAGDLPGLLVLGSYRPGEVDATHPLSALLTRLHNRSESFGELVLGNLDHDDLTTLVAQMLRLPAEPAAALASVLGERTHGNPFDTQELLNALRRDGLLVPQDDGWSWDREAVRHFVGTGDVVDVLGARIEALPPRPRYLIEEMSCLGAEVGMGLFSTASGRPAAQIATDLRAAVDDGLVMVDTGSARFRHDRVQQAAHARLNAPARAGLSLRLARRLADHPEHAIGAAPHYLAGLDLLLEETEGQPQERGTAAGLLRQAAVGAGLIANYAAQEAYLSGALRLLDPEADEYADIRVEHHAALCALGRFDAADVLFDEVRAVQADPVGLARLAAQQVDALMIRGLSQEALALGLDMLARLGVVLPDPAERGPQTGARLHAFYAWLATASGPAPIDDPRLLAIAELCRRMVIVTFFADITVMAWLVAYAAEVWIRDGCCEALAGTLAYIGLVTLGGGGSHRDAYSAVSHVLAVCERSEYRSGTSQVKFLHAVATAPWFEPVGQCVDLLQSARDGLQRGGDLHNALQSWNTSLTQDLLWAGVDTLDADVRAALAFADRLGATREKAVFSTVGQLAHAMRTGTPQRPDGFDEEAHLAALEPINAAVYLNVQALSAAILNEDETLARHSARVAPLVAAIPEAYLTINTHVMVILGAQARVAGASGPERRQALDDLDRSLDFLAARAADQPGNFRHLHRFAIAVRAATAGDFAGAAAAFDAAMSDALIAATAWHRPLVFERAALFYRAHGLRQVSDRLLAEALNGYAAWGAVGKVRVMRRQYPALPDPEAGAALIADSAARSVSLSTAGLDLIAVLEAARALSSETDMAGLRVQVEHVLGRLTGATSVQVVLRDDQNDGWVLPGDGARPDLPVTEAAAQGLLPLTVIRYAERTREHLLVRDAVLDDRIGRDPYFAGLETCSLLVVPVLANGQPRALLLLENRLSRSAFSAGRLDAALLIAGQLAVSLENARLYALLERKVAERTEELAEANCRLELLSITDPLTGLANRRRLEDFLHAEWARAHRSRAPIGVLMIDVDEFKKYNDRYGHQLGDDCLRVVARTIAAGARKTDLVARYGGEEFCVVLPDTDLEQAVIIAERIRGAVAERAEPHEPSAHGVVTVSVGVAAGAPDAVADPDQLTKLADDALYGAKRAGRNRVGQA